MVTNAVSSVSAGCAPAFPADATQGHPQHEHRVHQPALLHSASDHQCRCVCLRACVAPHDPLRGSPRAVHSHWTLGTYVKEFVHGDLGRTTPNVGELLVRSRDWQLEGITCRRSSPLRCDPMRLCGMSSLTPGLRRGHPAAGRGGPHHAAPRPYHRRAGPSRRGRGRGRHPGSLRVSSGRVHHAVRQVINRRVLRCLMIFLRLGPRRAPFSFTPPRYVAPSRRSVRRRRFHRTAAPLST